MLKLLYTAFLHNIKLSGYRIGMQFDISILVAKQNNYAIKIVNACIVYDLDDWPKISLNNFKFKKKKMLVWCNFYSKKK